MATITLKEIAQTAGVSLMTVSKVVNKKDHDIGTATRERVWKIAQDLNYRPNYYASALKTGRTNCIGITSFGGALGNFDRPYASGIYRGISDYFQDTNYNMIFKSLPKMEQVDWSLELVETRMADGLILLITSRVIEKFEQKALPALRKMNIPFVVIHSQAQKRGYPCVGLNGETGGAAAAEHLAGHNYETIGCVKFHNPVGHFDDMQRGFVDALQKKGCAPAPEHIFECKGFNSTSGYELAGQLLTKKSELPRALFVFTDEVASGMLFRFIEAGIRVPQDIALIGFGDNVNQDRCFTGLTTIRQPAQKKGFTAAQILNRLVENKKNEEQEVILDAPLVIRKSCGCS